MAISCPSLIHIAFSWDPVSLNVEHGRPRSCSRKTLQTKSQKRDSLLHLKLPAYSEDAYLSRGADLKDESRSEDDGMSLAASGSALSDHGRYYASEEEFISSAQLMLPSQTEKGGQESMADLPFKPIRRAASKLDPEYSTSPTPTVPVKR